MAMAQRLEVYLGAGDRAKVGGEKKGIRKVAEKEQKVDSTNNPGKQDRRSCSSDPKSAKEVGQGQGSLKAATKKEKSNSKGSVSIVEEITS